MCFNCSVNINVVMIAGGTNKWHNSYIDSTETSIYELTETGFEKRKQQKIKNMGSAVIKNYTLYLGISIIVFVISTLITFSRSHKNRNYKNTTVADLLSEVKVSGVTSIPCIIKGEIIGRGNPGYIFSEDFVIKDETGIIFLDYNQPLSLINKLFALLKSKKYINKQVEIKGWYKRSPIPYIEIHSIYIDGKTKRCHTYAVTKALAYISIAVGIFISIIAVI